MEIRVEVKIFESQAGWLVFGLPPERWGRNRVDWIRHIFEMTNRDNPLRRGMRQRRPWWRRKRWWFALGFYSAILGLVLHVMAERRVNRHSPVSALNPARTGEPRAVTRTADASRGREISAAWPFRNASRGLLPAQPAPDAALPGDGDQKEPATIPGVSWLRQPERGHAPRQPLPGFSSLKPVTLELPDLKDMGGH